MIYSQFINNAQYTLKLQFFFGYKYRNKKIFKSVEGTNEFSGILLYVCCGKINLFILFIVW